MNRKQLRISSILILFSFFVTSAAFATMTSNNYEIRFDQFGQGGNEVGTSDSYELRDSIGGFGVENSSSDSYSGDAGYREGVFDEVATFELFIMNRSTQVAATDLTDLTIEVTTANAFEIGDRVAVVQDEGPDQVESTGEIVSKTATSLTLNELENLPITVDGTDDYVYNLNGDAISLGTLSTSQITTAILGWNVNADIDEGYGVYVYEDEDLSTADNLYSIPDVADGSVTAGASEYGAHSDDSTLAMSNFDTQDSAFTTTPQLVASDPNFGMQGLNHLRLKISTNENQHEGTYSHHLNFFYVGDY